MINLKIYLDGNKDEYGYKYVMQNDCTAWTACRNDNEFRYFLQNTGLKIDPNFTQTHDLREQGKEG